MSKYFYIISEPKYNLKWNALHLEEQNPSANAGDTNSIPGLGEDLHRLEKLGPCAMIAEPALQGATSLQLPSPSATTTEACAVQPGLCRKRHHSTEEAATTSTVAPTLATARERPMALGGLSAAKPGEEALGLPLSLFPSPVACAYISIYLVLYITWYILMWSQHISFCCSVCTSCVRLFLDP